MDIVILALVGLLAALGGCAFGYLLGKWHWRVPELKPVEQIREAESIVERPFALPSFGKPELRAYNSEEYEEWLACCAGGELLTQGQQFYVIPITNADGLLALCLEHRHIPAKEKTP